MKIVLWLIVCCSVCDAQQVKSVNRLSWFSGFWRMETGNRLIDEFWTPVVNNRMEGNSVTKINGKITDQETIVIDQDSTGGIYYRAKPSRQKGTSFALVSLDSMKAVFENMKHDFPQRIIYRKISDDSLIASIEGIVKKKNKTIFFNYRKVIVNAD